MRRSKAMVVNLLVLGSEFETLFARIRVGSAVRRSVCPRVGEQLRGHDTTDVSNLFSHGKWMVCETGGGNSPLNSNPWTTTPSAFLRHFCPRGVVFGGMAST